LERLAAHLALERRQQLTDLGGGGSHDIRTSTFHHHFRAMTAMSPLQYRKTLRLNGARRLMLMERQDAATAAFRVGYESPSQFSREYIRVFGAPPLRDVTKLRQAGAARKMMEYGMNG